MFKKKSKVKTISQKMDEVYLYNVNAVKKELAAGKKSFKYCFVGSWLAYEEAVYGLPQNASEEDIKLAAQKTNSTKAQNIMNEADKKVIVAFEKWINSKGLEITSQKGTDYFFRATDLKDPALDKREKDVNEWVPKKS